MKIKATQQRFTATNSRNRRSGKALRGSRQPGATSPDGEVGKKTSIQRRYYLCSITELERLAQVVREHWAIENSQHWVLDVQFGEDANRSRKDHSATNLALIRRMVLNLLRRVDAFKHSIRRRKMRAAFNDDYRYRVLFGNAGT